MKKVMKLVQYGGAVFSRLCPGCKKEANPQEQLSVNRFMMQLRQKKPYTVGGVCDACGDIKLPFIGWEEDYE